LRERDRVRGKWSYDHPSPSQAPPQRGSCPGGRLYEPAATLILPHQALNLIWYRARGRKVF